MRTLVLTRHHDLGRNVSDAHRRVGGVHALPTRAEGELATEVRALLADAERTNSAEDAVHGDRRGDELPAELARGPVRGLKTDRTASVVIQGHAFVQNLRRGHCELGIDAAPVFRLATAFDELQLAI